MQLSVSQKPQSQESTPLFKNQKIMVAKWILVDSRLVCQWIPKVEYL